MQKIRIEFPKVPWMPEGLSGYVELHMHTNEYACSCSLSVIFRVAMVIQPESLSQVAVTIPES